MPSKTSEPELVMEELACFELESSEVYINLSIGKAYVSEIEGDDDSDDIILMDDNKLLFSESIELFGQDTLTVEQFNGYIDFLRR